MLRSLAFLTVPLVLATLTPAAAEGPTNEKQVQAEEYLAHKRAVRESLDAKEEAWRQERQTLAPAVPARALPPVGLPPRQPLATYDRGSGPIR